MTTTGTSPTTTTPTTPITATLPTTVAGGLVLRRVDPDAPEVRGWAENIAIGFHNDKPVTDEVVGMRREGWRGSRLSGAFDGDLCVGTFRSWDTTLTVPGGSVIADAVSAVTVRPTHRRRGILSTLMAADLADAAARGVPLAILIASEAVIYGRYGYGLTTQTATWEVDVRAARFRAEVPAGGRVDLLPETQARAAAPQVYAAARRPGAIDRMDHWFDHGFGVKVMPGQTRGLHHAAVHTADDGAPTGYVTYHVEDDWTERTVRSVVHVDDFQAATPEAYAGLWRFLLGIDLVATVRAAERALDEPLPWLLTDWRAARRTAVNDFQWHRLLDPAAALSSRWYERPGTATFEVVDGVGGWATGVFTLDVDPDGAGRCRRTPDAAPEVTLPVDVLSSVWLGGGDLPAAVWAGRVGEHTDGAAARLAAILATTSAPYTGTWF